MKIGQICSPMVVVAHPDMTVADAARVMRKEHVGSVVVVEKGAEGKSVVGILTDRDIVLSVVAPDLDARTMLVGDVMQRELVSVTEDDTVADALYRMRQHGVRRMPVVSERGILHGIVTADDVLAIIADELNDLVSTVHREQRHESATRK